MAFPVRKADVWAIRTPYYREVAAYLLGEGVPFAVDSNGPSASPGQTPSVLPPVAGQSPGEGVIYVEIAQAGLLLEALEGIKESRRKNPDQVSFELKLNVTYNLEGDDTAAEVKEQLCRAIHFLYNEGLFSGDLDSTLAAYSFAILG